MTRRLNYGARFNGGIADSRYAFDQKLAEDQHNDLMRMLTYLRNLPQYKRQLRSYSAAQKRSVAAIRRNGTEPQEREAAELRMVEAVAKVVEILEFHMEDMIQYRQFPNRPRYVSQIGIHNTIVQLRTKCGVKFEDNTEYDHVVHHSERRTEEQQREDLRNDMEEQRLARMRHNQEIAKRLIARSKT